MESRRVCCDRQPHKNGKDRQGYQRYRCPVCNKTWSDNPSPKKGGRPPIYGEAMSDAERQKKSRGKMIKKQWEPPCKNCTNSQCRDGEYCVLQDMYVEPEDSIYIKICKRLEEIANEGNQQQ